MTMPFLSSGHQVFFFDVDITTLHIIIVYPAAFRSVVHWDLKLEPKGSEVGQI